MAQSEKNLINIQHPTSTFSQFVNENLNLIFEFSMKNIKKLTLTCELTQFSN